MKSPFLSSLSASAVLLTGLALGSGPAMAAQSPEWSMNATVIEACSCTMFCPCYFNTKPSAHHEGHEAKHYCRANNAYKVNTGHYGDVKLDGAKWWISTDLGGDFSKMQMDWVVLTFDKATTKEQREGITEVAKRLFPVKWNSFKTAEGDITWNQAGNEAHALLDGGKTAEVHLKAAGNADNPAQPIVINNLKYWGARKNDGFVLMPNVVEAYRVGDKAFEYKGTNGFMLTLDVDSKTAPFAPAGQ
ncbi:MAG TPA: DUF1326 domain-containing protein [Candidatus Polarisedimenticolia bacterium]